MSVKAITWAIEQNVTPAGAKLLLIVLANYANDKHQCWPSKATLAADCSMSNSTVCKYLSELQQARLISVQKRFDERFDAKVLHRSSIITLQINGVVRVADNGRPSNGQGLSEGSDNGLSEGSDTNRQLEPSIEPTPYGEADASREAITEKTVSSQIWTEALNLLSQCQLSEPQRRKVIGKWQKRTPTELAKKELLAAVRAAAKAGTPEPISYVEAALREYPVPPDPRTFTAIDWRRKVRAAIKTKQWARDWGPPPGKRGCRVPPELITQQLHSALSEGIRQIRLEPA
jgi:hypothetical protein